MVKTKEDLTGKTFGRLTVMYQTEDYIAPSGQHIAMWHCICSCDKRNEIDVQQAKLKNKWTQSCGCLQKELAKERLSQQLKKYNIYDLTGDYGVGWTTNTNREFYFDLEDYDKIKDYCWSEFVQKDGYHRLISNEVGSNKRVRFHHLLGCKNYDHINRNSLDNRKENLRPATLSQNMQNRSLYKNNTSNVTGVSWNKRDEKWMAYIQVDNRRKSLGYFNVFEDAVIARLRGEKEYYKEFAPQQHLYQRYGV